MKRSLLIATMSGVLAIVTLAVIGVGIGRLRSSVGFSRIERSLTAGRRGIPESPEYAEGIRDAADFARSPGDFLTLLRLAWAIPGDARWSIVADIASRAERRHPGVGGFRLFAHYATIRSGESVALEAVLAGEPAGELAELTAIYAALTSGPGPVREPDPSLVVDHPEVSIVLRALRGAGADASWRAFDLIPVEELATRSALASAREGDRAGAARLRRVPSSGTGDDARLVLAAWTEDADWLYEELQRQPPTRAVESDALLFQADALYRQRQLAEAAAITSEVLATDPTYSWHPWLNVVVLDRLRGVTDRDAAADLRRGLAVHGSPEPLVAAWFATAEAGAIPPSEITATVERITAAASREAALRDGVSSPRHRSLQRIWLTVNDVGPSPAPPERRIAEMWRFLNVDPDADLVAGSLLALLRARGDATGIDEFRGRYSAIRSEWAATAHLLEEEAIIVPLADLPAYVRLVESREWWAIQNAALIALRHGSLQEADRATTLAVATADRLDPRAARYADARARSRLLRAEFFRLSGDVAEAIRLTEAAIEISPDPIALYGYRAFLASTT